MNNKTFAFKLAEKKVTKDSKKTQWKARDGVAVAGCTDAGPFIGNYRWPSGSVRDAGMYC